MEKMGRFFCLPWDTGPKEYRTSRAIYPAKCDLKWAMIEREMANFLSGSEQAYANDADFLHIERTSSRKAHLRFSTTGFCEACWVAFSNMLYKV